jgi:hypothetical protein
MNRERDSNRPKLPETARFCPLTQVLLATRWQQIS